MVLGSTQLRTEMGKGSRCIRLTTLPPSCTDCLEIWEPQPPGTLGGVQASNRIAFNFYTLKSKCLRIATMHLGTFVTANSQVYGCQSSNRVSKRS
jgi:hypothetical protein